ncbi:MAG: M56 family metallopeptidase [Bacteroidota bacterium]
MEAGIYLLKSVAILSLFYMVYYVFLRKDTHFTAKRHFFLGGIIAAISLPFLEFTRTIYKEAPMVLQPTAEMELSMMTSNVAVAQEPVSTWTIWEVALVVYLIGVLIMAARLTAQIISLWRLLRKYPSEKHRNYTFVKVHETLNPFSFFRYIVFNPASHSEEELKMILKHEQVHVSQWHSIDIIVGHITRALQWINPFSWLYKKSLEENLEFIADYETVAQVPSKKEYQLTLVKTSSPLRAPVLGTQFYQSFIKKRIIMLNKSTSRRRNLWKLSFVVPVLALFLWSFNVKEVIAYKELEVSEPERAVSFLITSESTDAELDAIERNLQRQSKTGVIRFDDRHRNDQDELYKFSIRTKFQNQFDFHTNAVLGDDTGKGISTVKVDFNDGAFRLQDPKNESVLRVTEEGVQIEMPAQPVVEAELLPMETPEPVDLEITDTPVETDLAVVVENTSDPLVEFKYTITKNTTDAQLDEIKAQLKKEFDIDMKYKAKRNSNGEIISINISYNDGKGGSGNYSINNDDEPINEFVFYQNEEGSGFWSEEVEARRAERMERRMEERARRMEDRARRMQDREVEIVEMKERAEKRQVEMKERMKERMKDREVEMKIRQKELMDREVELARRSNTRAKLAYKRAVELDREVQEVEELEEAVEREIAIAEEGAKWRRLRGSAGEIVVIDGDNDDLFVITKNTSDSELKDLKREMAALGTTFNYSKVKRNSSGELTRIKVTTNDGKGSKSVVTALADDGEPISDIIIRN